jgi:hypothetical protein
MIYISSKYDTNGTNEIDLHSNSYPSTPAFVIAFVTSTCPFTALPTVDALQGLK